MQERKERSADAQFIQIYETGAMLENIYANGASSGRRIVTTSNRNTQDQHITRNQKNKPRSRSGANRYLIIDDYVVDRRLELALSFYVEFVLMLYDVDGIVVLRSGVYKIIKIQFKKDKPSLNSDYIMAVYST